jgi:hypothetical protein
MLFYLSFWSFLFIIWFYWNSLTNTLSGFFSLIIFFIILYYFFFFFVVRLTLNHHYTEPRRYQHFFNPLHFTTNDFLYLLVITSYIFLFYLSFWSFLFVIWFYWNSLTHTLSGSQMPIGNNRIRPNGDTYCDNLWYTLMLLPSPATSSAPQQRLHSVQLLPGQPAKVVLVAGRSLVHMR